MDQPLINETLYHVSSRQHILQFRWLRRSLSTLLWNEPLVNWYYGFRNNVNSWPLCHLARHPSDKCASLTLDYIQMLIVEKINDTLQIWNFISTVRITSTPLEFQPTEFCKEVICLIAKFLKVLLSPLYTTLRKILKMKK